MNVQGVPDRPIPLLVMAARYLVYRKVAFNALKVKRTWNSDNAVVGVTDRLGF